MAGTLYKLRNFFTVDSGGGRVLFGAGVRYVLLGAVVAFGRSLTHGSDGSFRFDWKLFGLTLGGVVVINLLSNLFDLLVRGGRLLPPLHGQVFRSARKRHTAAAIAKITLKLSQQSSEEDSRQLISELLDCIVSHVRDTRGSHDQDRIDVFANLLIEDGDEIVVVARDSTLRSARYQRATPVRYRKAGMLATRALAAKKALSVGDLCVEYPEAPRNKPYKSILAIPIYGTDEAPLGIVSVDSSRPFFQSFQSGMVENSLENGLLPYLQLLVLVLERLVTHNRSELLKRLIGDTDAIHR